ncbi:ACT domain-containing protein [Desulfomicrobium orale]|uniref:Amino acid-binding protein n=1 Tax=Desulfomicrobium orale DSM 12838 TaxID=888061 RepID=A0A120KNF0_9BACT|nr:ACT domain-containing protein [Desulfomicrobium orale]AMD93949.1 amino acid-binding protein [Desulfomicrobium orale DSM 12838]MDO4767670.1 ACT domain-containing protein [Pseudomonadota bacterium]
MKVEQISVFLENRAGRLAEVTRTLAENNVNIRALSLADTSDFGILRLIVTDNEKAKEALKAKGFTVGRTNVVAAEVGDNPGGLHNILEMLAVGNVNVEYMYAFVTQSGHNAVLVFRFDQTDKAIEVLRSNGVRILSGEELYAL